MISAAEMAVVDANAEALGIPRRQLMESSGNAVARVVRDVADPGSSVALVCGRGNNGGDTFVATRFLDEYDTTVHLLGRPDTISTHIAQENWKALEQMAADTRIVRDSTDLDLGNPAVAVDGLLGTGVAGPLREPIASAVARLNDLNATVVAVDVPSGIDPDTGTAESDAVAADHVVTFHDQKPGLVDLDAEVTVADIGIPDAAELFVEAGDLLRLDRETRSHKGDNGEVLVIGGGPYTGAPALAGQAALRAGADLVRIACPGAVAREIQGYSANLIVRPFAGDFLAEDSVTGLVELAASHDTVVVGPGLGAEDATLEAVATFLAEYSGTAVVDAEAIQVVPELDTEADLLCTPHQGELAQMGGETDDDWRRLRDHVQSFAEQIGHTLLVKGPSDVISNAKTTRVNRTGNAGMTVGGTGDVLAGVAGALATSLDPIDAGAVAAYANGRAGDIALDEQGFGIVATDVLAEVSGVLWRA